MRTAKKTNSTVKSVSRILLAAALLMAACPIPVHASGDNQGVMDAFPAPGVSSDTMNENNGTISTLYGGGTIGDNKGTISSSRGTVYANHGSIESLSAGKVGTNYGTINRIENYGLLEINYMDGTVGFVGMGNEVGTNYGTIQDNAGIVYHYYGEISNNYSTVHMHGGRIQNNYKNGTVTFGAYSGDDYISSLGSLEHNEGSVIINSGEFTIDENKGNIVIANAFVEVFDNYGNITLGPNARLICNENMGSGVITKTDKSAVITCYHDTGTIKDETAAWYKIVFAGDDGKAAVTECDKEENGVYYTQAGSVVTFTLPPEYECSPGMIWEAGNVNTWIVNAAPAAGSTEFTIFCHKCTPGDYRMTKDTHFQICAGCGKTLTETEGAHTFGEFVSNDDATCIKDGTETGKCTVCGYKRTRTAVDSHLTSDHHGNVVIDPRVEPAETTTGLTQGSHCEDCNKVLTAQTVIPALGHSWQEATCTAPKTCSGCGATEGQALGHTFGEWVTVKEPTLSEVGSRERTCSVCSAAETEELAVLPPVTYRIISGANGKWTRGSSAGLSITSNAPFDKFEGIKVDGAAIPAENYTAVSGSTKVTLAPAYLETLSIGDHAIEITSADGSASSRFTVKNAVPAGSASPQTGDSSNILLWAALLLVSSGALAGTAAFGKKR